MAIPMAAFRCNSMVKVLTMPIGGTLKGYLRKNVSAGRATALTS